VSLTRTLSTAKLTLMRSLNITVAGKTFQIKSDADDDYLKSLANEITERFIAIKRTGARQEQEFKAMAMVAISLLDDLNNARKNLGSVRQKARRFAEQMIAKIDDLLSDGSV
jgi:cell division protein ZapA (FtsZ GTPase activity inhibitor)